MWRGEFAKLMRFGAMSGLRVGYVWREWRKRHARAV